MILDNCGFHQYTNEYNHYLNTYINIYQWQNPFFVAVIFELGGVPARHGSTPRSLDDSLTRYRQPYGKP